MSQPPKSTMRAPAAMDVVEYGFASYRSLLGEGVEQDSRKKGAGLEKLTPLSWYLRDLSLNQ